jgi:hypothetical protein
MSTSCLAIVAPMCNRVSVGESAPKGGSLSWVLPPKKHGPRTLWIRSSQPTGSRIPPSREAKSW